MDEDKDLTNLGESFPNPVNTTTSTSDDEGDWYRRCLPYIEISGIPQKYQSKGLDDFNCNDGIRSQINEMKDRLKQGGSIFLSGKPGCGKTHLACALMRGYAGWCRTNPAFGRENPYTLPFIFHSVDDILMDFKTCFNKDSETTEYQKLRHYSWMFRILDDIATEKQSEWNRSILGSLIDHRYRDNAQTIITSNASLSELAERLDDRTASRISEMCLVVNLKLPDYRQVIARGQK